MSKKKKRKLNIRRAVFVGILLLGFIIVGVGTGFAVGVLRNLPDLDTDFNPDVTTFIHDKDGKEVVRLHGVENRIPVDLNEIPQDLKEAFIATEDRAFYKHPGINPSSFIRAAIANFRAGGIVQGGSTITMQLVENAFFTDNPSRTYRRKLQEAFMAIQMERHYTKDEILEAYLNQIYFGHGAYGVQAAAQVYFGKDVSDLTLAESALIAGITNNPAAFSPYNDGKKAKLRRGVVLDNMVEADMITSSEAEAAKEEPIKLTSGEIKKDEGKYPYYIDAVVLEAEELLKEKGMSPADLYRSGLHIYTGLDPDIQEKMESVYSNANNFPNSSDNVPVESAMVLLDPQSGEVRGLVGGREHTVERGLNRAVQTKRQPGSVIKPLVAYGPALEEGYSPGTVIDDVPVTYSGGSSSEAYSPRNYDGRYRGLITMREAIRYSVNIPAVKTLERIGIGTGYNFGKNLGLSLTSSDQGLSLALGGLTHGVSPMEIASAYGAFANEGMWVEHHTITRITDKEGNTLVDMSPRGKAVMSPETAYMMTDMLRTVVSSGTGTRAQISGHDVAGKTGTTQLPDLPVFEGKRGEKDAWFVGYTPELVGVVWLGYDKTTTSHYLHGLYGGSSCAPIWKAVMVDALRHTPSREISRPSGIVWASIDAKSGKLPSSLTPKQFIIKEMFAKGTVPTEMSDVWVRKEVCAVSGLLPSDYCPETVTKVFLKRPIPYTGSARPEDAYLEVPTKICNIHTSTSPFGTLPNSPEEDQPSSPTEGDNSGFSNTKVSLRWSRQGNTIKLSWSSTAPESVIYSVEKWTSNGSKTNIGTTRNTSWTDGNHQSSTVTYYRVAAINPDTQERIYSNTVEVSQ